MFESVLEKKKKSPLFFTFFLFCLSVDDLSMYNQRANRRNLSAEKEKKRQRMKIALWHAFMRQSYDDNW